MSLLFDSVTSFSFLCIATPKTSNFSNFHPIKLEFGLGVDFGTLSSNFNTRIGLTLLPTGGGERGFSAHTIRLAARTPKPFHLESPKFLISLLSPLDTLWRISGKLICQGG